MWRIIYLVIYFMVVATFILLLLNVYYRIDSGLHIYCHYGVAKLFIIYVVTSRTSLHIHILLFCCEKSYISSWMVPFRTSDKANSEDSFSACLSREVFHSPFIFETVFLGSVFSIFVDSFPMGTLSLSLQCILDSKALLRIHCWPDWWPSICDM